MGFLALAVIGLFAGLLASAVGPGARSLGLATTIGFGLAGSFLGAFAGALLYGGSVSPELQPSSIVASVLGAALMLVVVRGRRARRVRA